MDRRFKKRIERYWNEMESDAISILNDLDYSTWFDYWHCHMDNKGKGDSRPDLREYCLRLGYKLLKYAEEKCSNTDQDIQCWWSIHEESYDDAIYIHTENENGSPYPYDFEDADWNNSEFDLLNDIVDTKTHRVGKITNNYGITFVVERNA